MPLRTILFLCALLLSFYVAVVAVGEQKPIADAEFDKLHTLIKPAAGESRWMEIDWYPNVWEARKQAAAEGKPLFLMAGSGGAPAAGC